MLAVPFSLRRPQVTSFGVWVVPLGLGRWVGQHGLGQVVSRRVEEVGVCYQR